MERMEDVEGEGDRVVGERGDVVVVRLLVVGEGEREIGEGERGWNWKDVGRGGRGVRPKGRDIACLVGWLVVRRW